MDKDIGILVVLIERLEKQRLPRVFLLKDKVFKGIALDDLDLEFLEKMLKDARKVLTLVSRHPEYQNLAAKLVDLYCEITEKDLALERNN